MEDVNHHSLAASSESGLEADNGLGDETPAVPGIVQLPAEGLPPPPSEEEDPNDPGGQEEELAYDRAGSPGGPMSEGDTSERNGEATVYIENADPDLGGKKSQKENRFLKRRLSWKSKKRIKDSIYNIFFKCIKICHNICH